MEADTARLMVQEAAKRELIGSYLKRIDKAILKACKNTQTDCEFHCTGLFGSRSISRNTASRIENHYREKGYTISVDSYGYTRISWDQTADDRSNKSFARSTRYR